MQRLYNRVRNKGLKQLAGLRRLGSCDVQSVFITNTGEGRMEGVEAFANSSQTDAVHDQVVLLSGGAKGLG